MNLIGSLFIDHKLPPFDPLAHIKRKGDHNLEFETPSKQCEYKHTKYS